MTKHGSEHGKGSKTFTHKTTKPAKSSMEQSPKAPPKPGKTEPDRKVQSNKGKKSS